MVVMAMLQWYVVSQILREIISLMAFNFGKRAIKDKCAILDLTLTFS